jgi:pimeloyl-ACP methyl ester carboxylesterase
MTYTDVMFRTSDGVALSAWYVPSTNRSAVVLLHGSGSTRTATLAQAEVLARHGYGALLVDARGQGRSGGHAMDLGWYGDRDVRAAVAFLLHRPDVDPGRIAVLGLSMGAEEAIGAAAAEPAIRAVVAEGATARTAADKSGWLPHGLAGAVQRGLDWLTYATTDLLSAASAPRSLHDAVTRATGTRFLLITAGNEPDETQAAAYLRGAAPDRVQVWRVAGASHTHGLVAQPSEWTTKVVTFLDQALAGQS